MLQIPDVNSLLFIELAGNAGYRSRIEDSGDGTLAVAAPIRAGDIEVPPDGTEFNVFWTTVRARTVLPVRLVGVSRQKPVIWHLEQTGECTRVTRRQFVRGGGGVPIVLTGPGGAAREVESTVMDLSEGGVRCRYPDADLGLDVGDEVRIRVALSEAGTEQRASVLGFRPPAEGGGTDVVLTYRPDEVAAQLIRRHVFAWEIDQRRRENALR